MIHLFTDFGLEGSYIGQVKRVLQRDAPGTPVIDLFTDAPPFDPRAAAYLLAAYDATAEPGDVIVAVVDPGVGGARAAIVLAVEGRWYVGPDNGIFEAVLAQAQAPAACWEIVWRPERASATFHGRDIFAPVAAAIATGNAPADAGGRQGWYRDATPTRMDWPADLGEIVYVDHFGNLVTGIRAVSVAADARCRIAGDSPIRAHTFSDVSPGQSFCYENADGLMEIAVNQGRADAHFGVGIGGKVDIC